jgi:hypothetical protein
VNESFAFHTLTTIVLMNFHNSFIAKQNSLGEDFNKIGQQLLGVLIWIKARMIYEDAEFIHVLSKSIFR